MTLDTFDLAGVECLVRWDHEQFGTLHPEEFISIAVETGIIEDIGRWMIDSPEASHAVLRKLRTHGPRIRLDGFGTGHASLGLIRRVPFNSMKLDRSLMADL